MIKILFLAANPASVSRLDLERESRVIRDALATGDAAEQFELHTVFDNDIQSLARALHSVKPQILHFCGHGSDQHEFIIEGSASRARPEHGLPQLLQLLDGAENPQCVVLNACSTADQAAALIRAVDSVVDMANSVTDSASIAFSKGFYRALASGDSVQKAFEEGSARMHLQDPKEANPARLWARAGVDPARVFLTHPLRTYFIYAKEDERYLKQFLTFLMPFKRQGILKWEDPSGFDPWSSMEPDAVLDKADLILPLVSPDALASEDFQYQTQRARLRHEAREAALIPVLVRRVDLSQSPFRSMRATPRSNPIVEARTSDAAWMEVMQDLQASIRILQENFRDRQLLPASSQGERAFQSMRPTASGPGERRSNQHPTDTKQPESRPPSMASATESKQLQPTRSSLRNLLSAVLRTESDFDAFCLDYFLDTYRTFSNGMDRAQKLNLLLSMESAEAILECLKQQRRYASMEHLLEYK